MELTMKQKSLNGLWFWFWFWLWLCFESELKNYFAGTSFSELMTSVAVKMRLLWDGLPFSLFRFQFSAFSFPLSGPGK